MNEPITVEPSPTLENPATPHAITVEVLVRIQAIALKETDGRYSVAIPALPGCVTQADGSDDIQANVIEAVEGWLAASHDRDKAQAIRDMLE